MSTPPVILLADDEPGTRRALAATLRRQGYEVREAADLAGICTALQMAPAPRLLIADCGMNGGRPRAMVEMAGQHQPGTRVILMSGYSQEALQQRGELPAGQPFLAKPFSRQDLLSLIDAELCEPPASSN